jgi:hypothetical protein
MNSTEIFTAMKAYARKHYQSNGWYIIRNLTDKELRVLISDATTLNAAYRRARKLIAVSLAA